MWYFSPWEALPAGEADCDGWVEVATGGGGTGDDGEGDANGEAPTNLENAAEGGDTDGGGAVDGKACYGCDTGEAGSTLVKDSVLGEIMARHLHVEEHACCFGHAFPQPARSVIPSE